MEDVWAAVRAELMRTDPGAASWIDSELSVDPTKTQWVPIAHYAQMMDALLAAVGRERTYALGRERAHRTAQAGAFAPVVRSWARSFGSEPAEFIKVTLHAWTTQTQNLGEFELVESRPGYARFRMREASPLLRASVGWRVFLAGYGNGLLDLIERPGRCEFAVSPDGVGLDITYTYAPAPAAP